ASHSGTPGGITEDLQAHGVIGYEAGREATLGNYRSPGIRRRSRTVSLPNAVSCRARARRIPGAGIQEVVEVFQNPDGELRGRWAGPLVAVVTSCRIGARDRRYDA